MLKVSENVKTQWKYFCETSWAKCNGDEQLLEYKIRRAVNLGEHTLTVGEIKVIRYHYLNFNVTNTEILGMYKNKELDQVYVEEETREVHRKLLFEKKLGMDKVDNWQQGVFV